MKRFLVMMLIVGVMVVGVGCTQIEYPEGVENKTFYKDMVKCVKLADKALETKNGKYLNDINDLITKNTSEDYLEIVLGLKPTTDDDYGLTAKESEILSGIIGLNFSATKYIDEYYSDSNIKSDVKIDTGNYYGDNLYKSFQEVISIMEIDYEIKLK